MRLRIIFSLALLPGYCSAATQFITTGAGGNVNSIATFTNGSAVPDCTGASGDTIKVVGGSTLTFNINCHLGSTTVGVGHALWVTGTAGNLGTVIFNPSIVVQLDGLDISINANLLVDQYGVLNATAANGGSLLMGCPSDNACRFNINGQIDVSPTFRIGAPDSQANWNTDTGAVSGGTYGYLQVDKNVHPNVWAYQAFGESDSQSGWVSNVAGTGPATQADASLTGSKLHVTGCSPTCFQNLKTSWSQISASGDYFIDYDAARIFFFSTGIPTGTINIDSFKILSFVSGGIFLTANTSFNEGIFNGALFKYCGTYTTSVGCLTFANKQSDTLSGSTHRKAQVVNSTFSYTKDPIWFTGTMNGSSGDNLLFTGNKGNTWICNGSIYLCGWVTTPSSSSTSYITLDSNVLSGTTGDAVLVKSYSSGSFLSHSNWTMTNNVLESMAVLSQSRINILAFPDLDIHGNFCYSYGNSNDSLSCVYQVEGTSGHQASITSNVMYQNWRPYNFGSYDTFTGNFTFAPTHHMIVSAWGILPHSGFINHVDIEHNISVSGTAGNCFTLGYLASLFMNDITYSQNTCVPFSLAQSSTLGLLPGLFSADDQQDAASGTPNGPAVSSSRVNVYNNLAINSYFQAGRYSNSAVYNGKSVIGLSVVDHNDMISGQAGGGNYCKGIVQNNVAGDPHTCIMNTLATFTQSGGEYNVSGTKNITGVTLHDPTYSTPLTGGTLSWAYSSPTSLSLAWNGGTAVSLLDTQNSGTVAAANYVLGVALSGRLSDTGQSWITTGNSSSNPVGDWVLITGGTTGVGQIRRVTAVDTGTVAGLGCSTTSPFNCIEVEPPWTTVPTGTITYVLWKGEVTLNDSGGAGTCTVQTVAGQQCWIRAAITPWSLATQDSSLLTPSVNQIDTGIGISFNSLGLDPNFIKPSGVGAGTTTSFLNANLGTWGQDTQSLSGDDFAAFQAIQANPSLTMSSFLPYMRAAYTPNLSAVSGNCVLNTAGYGTTKYFGAQAPTLGSGCNPAATTPTFSPIAGTYTSVQSVTISTTAGPVICYNTTGSPATNGATGCTAGTLYVGAVSVTSSETLYAVAGGTGYTDSAVASAAYVINVVTGPPNISGGVSLSGGGVIK